MVIKGAAASTSFFFLLFFERCATLKPCVRSWLHLPQQHKMSCFENDVLDFIVIVLVSFERYNVTAFTSALI